MRLIADVTPEILKFKYRSVGNFVKYIVLAYSRILDRHFKRCNMTKRFDKQLVRHTVTIMFQVRVYSLRDEAKALVWKGNCGTISRSIFLVWKRNYGTSKHYSLCGSGILDLKVTQYSMCGSGAAELNVAVYS